ncbi:MAG: hypothetical protein WC495_02950 [Patescibacteria group bacterium]|jgi:hypothetical protein
MGPHGHVPVDGYTYYPWHLVYILVESGPVPCDTTGMGVHGIVLPENKDVKKDADATDTDNYFAYSHDKHLTIEDRAHIEVYAYTGGEIPIYTPIMTDGLGRIIEWVLDENLYTGCGFSLTLAATGPDEWIPIHFHPSGDTPGCSGECTEAQL